MSSRKYPPLTPSEIRKILNIHGFIEGECVGSHLKIEGHVNNKRQVVTVDLNEKDFGEPLMKSMIKQSGISRNKFYKTLKKTGKKIN